MNAWAVLFHEVFLPGFRETRLSELLLYIFFIFPESSLQPLQITFKRKILVEISDAEIIQKHTFKANIISSFSL